MSSKLKELLLEYNDSKKEVESLRKAQEATKKDKTVMMNTHFKLIKSNERLSTELESCRNELKKHMYSILVATFFIL